MNIIYVLFIYLFILMLKAGFADDAFGHRQFKTMINLTDLVYRIITLQIQYNTLL